MIPMLLEGIVFVLVLGVITSVETKIVRWVGNLPVIGSVLKVAVIAVMAWAVLGLLTT